MASRSLSMLCARAAMPLRSAIVSAHAAARLARPLLDVSLANAIRHHHPDPKVPVIFVGPGPIKGQPVTEWDIASGIERVELMADSLGVKLYDEERFTATRMGTLAEPVVVTHYEKIANIQCTGIPEGSHMISWIAVHNAAGSNYVDRCLICGSCYQVEFKKKFAFIDPETGKFTIKSMHPDEFAKIEPQIVEYARNIEEIQKNERQKALEENET